MKKLFVVAGTLQILAAASSAQNTSTIEWGGLERYRADNAKLPAAGAETRVVFMGNSITEAWARLFPSLFPGKAYIGRGISGQTTAQMLVRFRQDVIALKPAVVVILAGTNDIAGNTGPSTVEMIQDNLASMADLARANGIRVVLGSVLPVYDYPWKKGLEPAPKIMAINNWMKRYADAHDAVYVDFHSAMEDARHGMRAELAYDGVHPTEAGFRVMAPLVERGIAQAQSSAWIQLFNGRDLADWQIKFKGRPLGENLNNTFRVEDGLLKVRYDRWTGFNGEFGHIFHKQPFSHYVVAAEYRFVGEQVAGAGPGLSWALRNNGIMVHSQSPESMGLEQDFPMSLEVQLLGGLGRGPRSTGNLCTPGLNVRFGDTLVTRHCINSTSKTYDGDQWVRAEALVLGDSVIKHIVNGDTVLVYRKPEIGGGNANDMKPGVKVDGTPVKSGYIALQAETAPIDFRKVELRVCRPTGC
jgi:lysophospholipase L1-like esterase